MIIFIHPSPKIWITERNFSFLEICMREGFQGLRSVRKRSILGVCEHFEHERNEEITPSD